MFGKIVTALLVSNGKRTYALGLVMACIGVAVAAGIISPEDAAQVRALLEVGWSQVIGVATTILGLAVVAQRAGGKADVEALTKQIEELKAALETAQKEVGK